MMSVKEFIATNPDKASYTVKIGKKSYLCNASEAVELFGDREVQTVTYRYSKNSPTIHLGR